MPSPSSDAGQPDGAPVTRWTRSLRIAVGAVVVVHIALVALFVSPPIGWTGDDAEYVMLSRELRDGRYHDQYDVEAPVHARYPPGYPAVLAVVSTVAGESPRLFVALNAVFSAAMILLVADAVRRRYQADAVLATTLLIAINPELILWAGRVMSESLFAFLIVLGVWAEQRTRTARNAFLAGAATIGGALVRTAGGPLLASLVLSRLLARRWRSALLLALCAAGTFGAWTVHTVRAPDQAERNLYGGDLQVLSDGDGAVGLVSAVALRLPDKIRALTVDQLPTSLSIPVLPGNPVDNLVGVVVLALLLPVGLYQMARWWRPAALGLLVYGLANVVWPWTLVRFIVPVNGLLIACLIGGAAWWRDRLRLSRLSAAVLPVVVAYFASGALLRLREVQQATADCEYAAAYDRPGCYAHEEWMLFQAVQFVRDSTPADDLVFTEKAAPFYFHTGHRTVNATRLLQSDSLSLATRLRAARVRWVITSRIAGERSHLGRLVASACREFELVRSLDPYTTVLRVRAAGSVPEWGPACEATRIWRRAPEDRR